MSVIDARDRFKSPDERDDEQQIGVELSHGFDYARLFADIAINPLLEAHGITKEARDRASTNSNK